MLPALAARCVPCIQCPRSVCVLYQGHKKDAGRELWSLSAGGAAPFHGALPGRCMGGGRRPLWTASLDPLPADGLSLLGTQGHPVRRKMSAWSLHRQAGPMKS